MCFHKHNIGYQKSKPILTSSQVKPYSKYTHMVTESNKNKVLSYETLTLHLLTYLWESTLVEETPMFRRVRKRITYFFVFVLDGHVYLC